MSAKVYSIKEDQRGEQMAQFIHRELAKTRNMLLDTFGHAFDAGFEKSLFVALERIGYTPAMLEGITPQK